MNFHLQFPVQSFSQKINYTHSSLFIGSCFAENIGQTMRQHKFNVNINPHGIMYNPAAIAVALRRYAANKPMQEEDLFFENGCWNSWEHHSCFSMSDKSTCIVEMNKRISLAYDFLAQSEWLFITFGSAFFYKLKGSNKPVANCHKLPQKEFEKSLLKVSEIVEEYQLLVSELKKINHKLKIVFTVSPVRYIRDGVVENSLSKARLIEAVHEIIQYHDGVFYFPAYELVIGDLRDYRFYKQDLVHPNEQAIEYVFEKLVNTVFDEETKKLLEEVKEIVAAKQHRPFNMDSEPHQKFKAAYLERCKQLQTEQPFLNLSNEIDFFRQ